MTPEAGNLDRDLVDSHLQAWPDEPRQIAEDVMDSYGPPDEMLDSRLIWHDNGSWKRTELFREGVPHRFPKEHTDYLEQFIDYHVPSEKTDEVIAFDGSIIPERTKGEISARCDREAMNFLALNLAHEIVTGEQSVEQARREYAKTVKQVEQGNQPEKTRGLQFSPKPDQGDPDETIVTDALREKVKEMLTGEG